MKHSKKVSDLKVPTVMKIFDIVGQWRIYEMEMWDKDYFGMEVKAFIKIGKDVMGNFQFEIVKSS